MCVCVTHLVANTVFQFQRLLEEHIQYLARMTRKKKLFICQISVILAKTTAD